jgi:hypothetical protein
MSGYRAKRDRKQPSNFCVPNGVPTRMPNMRSLTLASVLLLAPLCCPAQTPPLTADEIMTRVAANQDRDDAARTHYLYVQHAHVASRKGKTVMCEETTDFRITPGTQGSERTLLLLDGRLLQSDKYVTYHDLPVKRPKPQIPPELQDDPSLSKEERRKLSAARRKLQETGDDNPMDQDLVENMRKNLTNEKSKDGLQAGLFPLTSRAQSQYLFKLKGRERRNGHDTFHITFTPRDKDDYGWRGDAWIDTEAFQPVVVQTAMSKNLPFAVRTLLGTSLPGLGFMATYASQPDGVWFPATFGSEFKINVLFFFHRTITLSVENHDFQKTHVESRIVGDATPTEPQP